MSKGDFTISDGKANSQPATRLRGPLAGPLFWTCFVDFAGPLDLFLNTKTSLTAGLVPPGYENPLMCVSLPH
jgi:hypothetical protein